MTDTKICRLISALLNHAEKCGMLDSADRIYAANTLCAELRITTFEDFVSDEEKSLRLHEILDAICEYAVENNIINEGITAHDLFDTKLMGILMPRPSEVTAKFFELYKEDPKKASDYFYHLSIDSNYIREDRVEKDRRWSVDSKYGKIDISINLSKPEKDPKDIAAAKLAPQSGYPKCLLCPENVGYAGHANAPARQNLRQIPFTLGGDEWLLQYSPYVYYNEHCIALSKAHVPMKICRETFARQLDFVTELPHYFIGSNADIPIVGGSILSHDHMQGGCYTFPMERAEIILPVKFEKFPEIEAGLVNWPMSVLRLRSKSKTALVELAEHIRITWSGYSDEANGVVAFTGDVPHNAITPIARRRGEDYELDLVLRNNLTSEEFPMGIYHPHADKHNIKKENIGLIEVMGLAILPARLKKEMARLAEIIIAGDDVRADADCEKHAEWLARFKDNYTFTAENAESILYEEIGKTFTAVLEDAGVYKATDEGRCAMMKFVEYAGGRHE
ncbi:MAG: UDP-glucose--hexose-1-phosphate uridylyltransferase [Clostridia bacterium]|nr:UDP-glucose--hexose-1-phosphate uridylyltransferase [Clostridia bacterium]